MSQVNLPNVITHKNRGPILEALRNEEPFRIGSNGQYDGNAWYAQEVTLEFPLGELCESGLKSLALVGRSPYVTVDLSGKEGFNAQGLEGKVQVRKPLSTAVLNLDLLAEYRGRVLVGNVAKNSFTEERRQHTTKMKI